MDTPRSRQPVAPAVEGSRIVQRPIPRAQIDDPREFQLSQIRRRFSPKEQKQSDMTVLVFKMAPSDPDFPFEIEALDCLLYVPSDYPSGGKPRLRVTNEEMERGYQINVEKGFDAIVAKAPSSTLLNYVNTLDKQLESILSAQKADIITLKLVPNIHKPAQSERVSISRQPLKSEVKQWPEVTSQTLPIRQPVSYSAEQKAEAKARRDIETRQLEARLGRLQGFVKSSNGVDYTLPLEPRKRAELLASIQAVKSMKLIVPQLYNLEPCRIELLGVSREDAQNVERAFKQRALENPQVSLVGHVNYFSQNIHVMAAQSQPKNIQPISQPPQPTVTEPAPEPSQEVLAPTISQAEQSDRSHIVSIPRPPEWSAESKGDEASDESSEYDSEYDTEDEADEEEETLEAEGQDVANPKVTAEKGILISFPHLELYSIELLELVSVNVTIKCLRCKDAMDISNIRNNAKGDYSGIRSQSCKKCANTLGIGILHWVLKLVLC